MQCSQPSACPEAREAFSWYFARTAPQQCSWGVVCTADICNAAVTCTEVPAPFHPSAQTTSISSLVIYLGCTCELYLSKSCTSLSSTDYNFTTALPGFAMICHCHIAAS